MQGEPSAIALTESFGIRLTAAERDTLEARAEAAGLTLGEWIRKVLNQSTSVSSDTRLILSELLAMRTLVLWLQAQTLKGAALTEETIRQSIQEVESTKLSQADRRIAKYLSGDTKEATA